MFILNLKRRQIFIRLLFILTYCFIAFEAYASAKCGDASVWEGETCNLVLADTYQRTLKKATNISYKWYSDRESYVSVKRSSMFYCEVKGLKPISSCRVYFKCSYFIDGYFREMDFYWNVEVKTTNVDVTKIVVSPVSVLLSTGDGKQLGCDIYPRNATNKNVTWETSKYSIASVDRYGFVTAKSPGTAVITCRAQDGSGCYGSCTVKVERKMVYVSDIKLNSYEETLSLGESFQLKANVYPTNASNQEVNWYSTNSGVAKVSSTGYVSAISIGSTEIICEAKDGSAVRRSCLIKVEKEKPILPSSISLSQESITIEEGKSYPLKVTVVPTNAYDKTVTWSSSDSSVAYVKGEDRVIAIKEGQVIITATTVNGLTATCEVMVKRKEVEEKTYPDKLYLIGAPNDFNIHETDYILYNKDGEPGIYEGSFEIKPSEFYFRFYSELGNFNANCFGICEEDEYKYVEFIGNHYSGKLYSGKGMFSFGPWKGGIVDIRLNLKDMTIEFIDKNDKSNSYYITGTITKWDPDNHDYTLVQTQNDENVAVFSCDIPFPPGQNEFKIMSSFYEFSIVYGLGDTEVNPEYLHNDVATGQILYSIPLIRNGLTNISLPKSFPGANVNTKLIFNKSNGEVKLNLSWNKDSAINEISEENSKEVRYFNLRGVEVKNPTKGIYIKISGNKSEKIYIQ